METHIVDSIWKTFLWNKAPQVVRGPVRFWCALSRRPAEWNDDTASYAELPFHTLILLVPVQRVFGRRNRIASNHSQKSILKRQRVPHRNRANTFVLCFSLFPPPSHSLALFLSVYTNISLSRLPGRSLVSLSSRSIAAGEDKRRRGAVFIRQN